MDDDDDINIQNKMWGTSMILHVHSNVTIVTFKICIINIVIFNLASCEFRIIFGLIWHLY